MYGMVETFEGARYYIVLWARVSIAIANALHFEFGIHTVNAIAKIETTHVREERIGPFVPEMA